MTSVRWLVPVLAAALLLPAAARADDDDEVWGVVDTPRRSVVVAPLTGQVRECSLAPGDRVEAGQLLAFLDVPGLQVAVERANLELEGQQLAIQILAQRLSAEEARVAALEAKRQQVRAAVEASRLSSEELARSEEEVRAAHLARETLLLERRREEVRFAYYQAALHAAEEQRDLARIRAPYAGVVADVHAGVGDGVRANESPIVTILDLDRLQVVAEVAAAELGRWKPGRAVAVMRASDPTRVGAGRVERVAPEVDPESQLATVFVALDGASSRDLAPGLAVQLRLGPEAAGGN